MNTNCPVCVECGAALAASSPALLCMGCLWGDNAALPAEAASGEGGLRVPGHEVLEEIARGGMGVVYRARERETQRTVALKMLRPRFADETGMRERFRLEASAVAALHHPGILPVYRVDETDDMPFFTMKLAAGGTLAERMETLHGKWREIASLMVTLTAAVQYAHQHGVLHRDVKPANVLFDEEGRAYLSDFGLVKLIDSVSDLTCSQSFLGTPHYSSPEIASACAGAATVACDVWSLGAMLYELLAGRLPFEAPGLAPLMRKIAEEPPAPFDASVPGDLRVIALKCLHKEPAQRYPSAAALGADLNAWLEGRPITARATTVIEHLTAWARRNPVLATVAAALMISLAMLGTVLWRGYAASERSAVEARAGERAARIAEAASLLEETRARLRGGEWVSRLRNGEWENRTRAIAGVLRSHVLNPSGGAPDVLVSLLALPNMELIGEIPYNGGNAVGLSGDFSRYLTRAGRATEIRDTLTHKVLFTVPEAAASTLLPGPLSDDGRFLALATGRNTGIWDVEAATRIATLPTGRWMPGFSRDGTITAGGPRILHLAAGPPSPLLTGDSNYHALSISPDGKLALMAHSDRLRMQLVDTSTGTVRREYELPGRSTILRAVWSANSRKFCTGSTDGRMMRWDVETSSPEWIVPAHTDGIDDLALFDDDHYLITVSRDGLAKIWNLETLSSAATFPWSGRRVQASTDGLRLALDDALDKKTLLFKFTPPPVCTVVRLPPSFVPRGDFQGCGAVVPAADGQSFAVTAGADLHILSRDGALLRTIPCGQCTDLLANPAAPGFIRVRRLVSNDYEIMRVPFNEGPFLGDPSLSLGHWNNQPVLTPDVRTGSLYTGINGGIRIIMPTTAERTPHLPSALSPRLRITAMAFSPCGRFFAWAGVEDPSDPSRRIHLMDAAGEKEIAGLPLREAPRLLAFLPSGNAIIAGNNGGFRCLDTTTGRELWSILHKRPQEPTLKTPVALAVAEKSGMLAASLTTDSISLIDPVTGRIRLTLQHPMGQTLRAIGLSPDGTRLIAVGSYIAQVWNLEAVTAELSSHGITF